MSNTPNLIFKGLQIASWIIFIGLAINAGGLTINFIFSIFNPEMVGDLYEQLDLSVLYNQSKWAFYTMFSFVLSIAILKAHLFFIVVRLIQKLDLAKPFSSFVSEQISKISYYTFSIGIISYIARQASWNLEKRGYEMDQLGQFWEDAQAFILMTAVIYLIAFIFKRGIEMQVENDLTI